MDDISLKLCVLAALTPPLMGSERSCPRNTYPPPSFFFFSFLVPSTVYCPSHVLSFCTYHSSSRDQRCHPATGARSLLGAGGYLIRRAQTFLQTNSIVHRLIDGRHKSQQQGSSISLSLHVLGTDLLASTSMALLAIMCCL